MLNFYSAFVIYKHKEIKMDVKMKTMTNEQKELLIKDLCARLPYGVKCAIKNSEGYHHENVAKIGETTIDKLKGFDGKYFNIYHDDPLDWDWGVSEVSVEDIKPYLFPLSSITKEQRDEFPFELSLLNAFINGHISLFEDEELSVDDITRMMDCLNRKHIDYRGLIPMGLAVDATGKNIY